MGVASFVSWLLIARKERGCNVGGADSFLTGERDRCKLSCESLRSVKVALLADISGKLELALIIITTVGETSVKLLQLCDPDGVPVVEVPNYNVANV